MASDKEIMLMIMIVYWVPIYIYLIIWSIRIRRHVRKHKIESLDTTHPVTYKVGKLTSFQLLGEAIVYAIPAFCGIFSFFIFPNNMIKDCILPDA